MALWTNISNALVAVGAKPFATTLQALRDNPVAIAEGAASAPRIRATAMQSTAAGAVVQRNCLPIGQLQVASNSGEGVKENQIGNATALVNCTVRVIYSVGTTTTLSGAASFQIFRSGTSLLTVSGNSTQTNQTLDVVLTAGQAIGIKIAASPGTGGASVTVTRLEYLVNDTTAGLI